MKIVGLMVCGAGEADRYLDKTISEFKRLTDDVVVALNNVDDKTRKMVKDAGFWAYEDNREWGKEQPNIKTDLLKKIGKLKPDWVLPLDADETLPSVDREYLKSLANDYYSAYFYVVNLYNDEQHYSRDLGFWNVRYFKYIPEHTKYLNKPLHCGLAPPFFYKYANYVPHIMVHRGLMTIESRLRKAERYKKYDQNAKYKGRQYYDALVAEGTGTEYKQEELLKKVNEEVGKMKQTIWRHTITSSG